MLTLLFDLGGVVVDYRGPERLAALSRGAMSVADAHKALSSSAALHAFERGEISPESFAETAVAQWRLDLAPEAFIADFETWPERFLDGAQEALMALRDRHRLACLSNINIPHWRRAEALGLAPLFDHAFLSHEMGARKPEPIIYERVIEGLKSAPETILFFDDGPANVDAARKAGLQAYHVTVQDGVADALRRAGVL